MAKQQEWIKEAMEERERKGQDTGFMAHAAALKEVTVRLKNEMQKEAAARPAYPSPSPHFVPGLPHVILIELRQALISYQD